MGYQPSSLWIPILLSFNFPTLMSKSLKRSNMSPVLVFVESPSNESSTSFQPFLTCPSATSTLLIDLQGSSSRLPFIVSLLENGCQHRSRTLVSKACVFRVTLLVSWTAWPSLMLLPLVGLYHLHFSAQLVASSWGAFSLLGGDHYISPVAFSGVSAFCLGVGWMLALSSVPIAMRLTTPRSLGSAARK